MKTDIPNQTSRYPVRRVAADRRAPDIGIPTGKNKGRRLSVGPLALLIGALLVLLTGCGGVAPTYYKSQGFDAREIKKVAVLPLDPLAGGKNAGERFRMSIIAELLSRGVDIVEPGEVIRALKAMNIQYLRGISVDDIKEIGKRLDADAVMTGSVGSYEMRKGINVSYPDVSINLFLYDTSSGEILWSVWHSTGGATFANRHFGTESRTLNEAAREVVKEAIDVLF